MKSTGMVRKLDDLGRVVIPKEIRRSMGLQDGEAMEFLVDDKGLLIRPYRPLCSVPGCHNEDVADLGGVRVCRHHWGEAGRVFEGMSK